MDIDVAKRLIDNLEADIIFHDQGCWLLNGSDVFTIEEEDKRWSCATSGCAAGFIFLQEAPVGAVFDTESERVFEEGRFIKELNDLYDALEWDSDRYADIVAHGRSISEWAGEKLGISSDEGRWLFYQFGDTEETINRVRFLMKGGRIRDFDPEEVY